MNILYRTEPNMLITKPQNKKETEKRNEESKTKTNRKTTLTQY